MNATKIARYIPFDGNRFVPGIRGQENKKKLYLRIRHPLSDGGRGLKGREKWSGNRFGRERNRPLLLTPAEKRGESAKKRSFFQPKGRGVPCASFLVDG